MGEMNARRRKQGRLPLSTAKPVAAESVTQAFENKAGRYELVRIDGNMAHYRFTNHQGHRTDAAMPLFTWRRLQEHLPGSPALTEVPAC